MKIDTTRLTLLFDQYSNQENRLTHALMHTLAGSGKILRRFLNEVLVNKGPLREREFQITTQKRPFSEEDTDSDKVDSVPDGWIVDQEGGLGIIIEVKDIKNSVRLGQLRAHLRKLVSFQESYLLVVTPDLKQPHKIDLLQVDEHGNSNIVWISWNDLYTFYNECRLDHFNKMPKEQYLLNAMIEYLEQRREVLGFQGIKFRKGFKVETAKAILMAEMEALQDKAQAIFPNLTGRRGAITTALSKSSVWDCFGVPDGFTNDIHITLSITEDYQDISLTVPHKAGKRWKRLKQIFGNDDECQEFLKILKVLRKNVPDLFLEYIQRHYLYQRRPVRDAFLEFHIDTFGPPFFNSGSKVKAFPIWFEAIKDAVVNKRKINAQVMLKVRFYYTDTEDIEQASFLHTAQRTLNNMKPLYDFLLVSA